MGSGLGRAEDLGGPLKVGGELRDPTDVGVERVGLGPS